MAFLSRAGSQSGSFLSFSGRVSECGLLAPSTDMRDLGGFSLSKREILRRAAGRALPLGEGSSDPLPFPYIKGEGRLSFSTLGQ